MPVLVAALVALGGFIWWSWGRRKAGDAVAFRLDGLLRRKPAKWRATGHGKSTLVEFQCDTCGVTAFSRTQKGPADCKRNLRGGL